MIVGLVCVGGENVFQVMNEVDGATARRQAHVAISDPPFYEDGSMRGMDVCGPEVRVTAALLPFKSDNVYYC